MLSFQRIRGRLAHRLTAEPQVRLWTVAWPRTFRRTRAPIRHFRSSAVKTQSPREIFPQGSVGKARDKAAYAAKDTSMENYRHQEEIPAMLSAEFIRARPVLQRRLVAAYGTDKVRERLATDTRKAALRQRTK